MQRRGQSRLMVMGRCPEPGRTKTRMIPELGPAGAAALQVEMTRHVLGWARAVSGRGIEVEVRFDGGDKQKMRRWFGEGLQYVPQGDGDLGERMWRGFERAFGGGCDRVVVIGTDCPAMTDRVLSEAFDSLNDDDVVIVPATDGGYCLLGLRNRAGCDAINSATKGLFEGIEWGGESVFSQTTAAAKRLGLSVRLMNEMEDIDRPEDLPLWDEARRVFAPPRVADRLSVIVPTLNEEANIGRTLERLRESDGIELIVADGGSEDRTIEIAERFGAHVVACERGRGRQMNRGAEHAHGDILLFCHADTLLPPGYAERIKEVAMGEDVAGGAFTLRIDDTDKSLRWMERTVAFRSRATAMPYGDQAIFVNRWAFERVGGYPEIAVMEDYELIRGLRQLGRVLVLNSEAKTSARYWRDAGVWRTSMINRTVVAGYMFGWPIERLARFRRNAMRR